MKNVLRILALTAAVSITGLSNAHAGTCFTRCNDGTVHSFAAANPNYCCFGQIDTYCPGGGTAYYNGNNCSIY
jgi:hypothetical protein